MDNAIEANATRVDVTVAKNAEEGTTVEVLDNGEGMTPTVLRRCLQFGGTSRFDGRQGIGRFGLGLPMSSLRYARRVSVYSWRGKYRVYGCHLDVDEVSAGTVDIGGPEKKKISELKSDTGTLVIWEKCDRLDLKRFRDVLGKIRLEFGRLFRRFLSADLQIFVNEEPVIAIDPLMLTADESGNSAKMYGPELRLSVRAQPGSTQTGPDEVVVRFTELPVEEWSSLSQVEKRRKGISRGAGVSILRAGREIDYGWFFMGEKRRENYDDWWRCEIEFSPVLDEEFGVSHTKQQIRPSERLKEILTPVVEPVARSLTMRARKTHEMLGISNGKAAKFTRAAQVERVLPTLNVNGRCQNNNIAYHVAS